MTDEILQSFEEIKNDLLDEAQDQLTRAEALDWATLEKHFREKEGYDDAAIEAEKGMFESMLRTSRFLANYGKKKQTEESNIK